MNYRYDIESEAVHRVLTTLCALCASEYLKHPQRDA
jgi:hypothetical protein